MSALTTATEPRNEFGLPQIEITASVPANHGFFHQAVDNSTNKALPWIAFSWFLSGGAIVGLIMVALLVPELIDSRVSAGVADARADMHKDIAAANETANAARMFGRVANEKSDRVLAQLEARGLVKQESH